MTACAIATVIGLLFLRPWAHYSILVIGGFLAASGVLSLLGITVAAIGGQFAMPAAPSPALTVSAMHHVFLIIGIFYDFVTALGTWWLAYFNRRATRAAIAPADRNHGYRLPGS